LIPTEPKAYAKFEQAASAEYAQFDPIASGLANEKIFKRYRGGVTDEKRVEELVALFELKLNGYETILGKQKYIAGDVRTRSKHPYGFVNV
jgi:glutathione S-transferase